MFNSQKQKNTFKKNVQKIKTVQPIQNFETVRNSLSIKFIQIVINVKKKWSRKF